MIAGNSNGLGTGIDQALAAERLASGPVGIVSTSNAALLEVMHWLIREGVGVSRTIQVGSDGGRSKAVGDPLLAGLECLQADPATDVIILVSKPPASGIAERLFAQVRGHDKPTVVCFPGGNQRLVWRTGAIPAPRLDEAAMRAAAWVRGWDQALVSSRLDDQDDQLARQADQLRVRIGPGRYRIQGLFTSSFLCHEARPMLADVTVRAAEGICLDLAADPSLHSRYLLRALQDPRIAVLLLDSLLDRSVRHDLMEGRVQLIAEGRDGILLITHECSEKTSLKAQLTKLGVTFVASHASAARLAGMVVSGLAEGQ